MASHTGTGRVIAPLLDLEREGRTGLLDFSSRGVTTRFHVRAGEIVFAEGGTNSETLGRLLVRWRRLAEDHVAAVVHRMIEALVDGKGMFFGEVLLGYGFVTEPELERVLIDQVREKLMGAVHRGAGTWSFLEDHAHVSHVAFVVATRPTLAEVAPDLPERQLEDILELSEIRYPEVVAPEGVIAAEFELTPEESAIIHDFDGTSAFPFLLSKWTAARLLPLAAALVLGGGIELRHAPAARGAFESRVIPPAFRTRRRAASTHGEANREDRTIPLASAPVAIAHHAAPGGATSFSTIAVVRPSVPPTRGPEKIPQDGLDRVRAAMKRLETELEWRRPAHGKRRWPSPKLSRSRRLMAESAFHKGRFHLRAEEAERALPGLHRALEIRTHEREYELWVKWAQMLVNDAFKDDDRRAEIFVLASERVAQDRSCALGYTILGHCMHHEAKERAALRFFQRAARLDPKLVDAVRLATLLGNRAASEPRLRASRPSIVAHERRDGLPTPLDELVPAPADAPPPPKKPSRLPPPRASRADAGAMTPRGGLRATRDLTPSPDVPPSFTPAVASLPPAPPPTMPPPDGTAPFQAMNATSALQAPTVAYAAPPPRLPPPPPAWPSSRSVPPPTFAFPPRPARKSRAWLVVLVPILALGGIGVRLVARRTPPTEPARPILAATASALGSAMANASASTTASAPVVATASAPVVATASTPTATATATATASVVAVAPATGATTPTAPEPGDAGGATTGTVKSRAYGRRVFVDGRVIGEGGRGLTAPCGSHRVRVGSAGTDRVVEIPCGGSIELD